MAIVRLVETLVLDLPATLGHVIERMTAHAWGGEIGQPESLDQFSMGFVLPVEDHANGLPAQVFPRIKVVRVPDFDSVRAVPESGVRRSGAKASLGSLEQLGQVGFQSRHDMQAESADGL